MTRSHAFSRALHQPHVVTSSFDWFNVLSVSYVIGQSNYFGFGFTTLKRKPLYLMKPMRNERNIPVNAVEDTDLKVRGGGGGGGRGGHPDPEIGGRVSKINFLALRASVWSKNKGGGGWSLLDPSLKCNPTMFIRVSFIFNIARGSLFKTSVAGHKYNRLFSVQCCNYSSSKAKKT